LTAFCAVVAAAVSAVQPGVRSGELTPLGVEAAFDAGLLGVQPREGLLGVGELGLQRGDLVDQRGALALKRRELNLGGLDGRVQGRPVLSHLRQQHLGGGDLAVQLGVRGVQVGDLLLSCSNLSGERGLPGDQGGALGLQRGDLLRVLPRRGPEEVRLHHAAVRQLIGHAVADPDRGGVRVRRGPDRQHPEPG
jgi:hypothetical protein